MRLNKKITIKKEVVTETENGFKEKQFVTVKDTWANFAKRKINTLVENEKETIEDVIELIIREQTLDMDNKIEYDDVLYTITSIEKTGVKRYLQVEIKAVI